MMKIKPDVVFSKGGFVACPVVWSAWMCRIPVVIHESDITPGLANRLSIPFAKIVCCSFSETLSKIPHSKGVLTGLPIRKEITKGKKSAGLNICGFCDDKPVIFITGGSLGATRLNQLIFQNIDRLLTDYQVCHQCGKGNIPKTVQQKGYKTFEYLNDELPHMFAMADLVISRAGATTIFEILSCQKLNILIPLSRKVSRGDQILNAKAFEQKGYSRVLDDDNEPDITKEIKAVLDSKRYYLENITNAKLDSNQKILDLLYSFI